MRTFSRLFAALLLPLLLLSACKGKESPNAPSGSTPEQPAPILAGPFEGIMYMSTTIPGEAVSEMKLFIGKQGVRTETAMELEGQSSKQKMIMIAPAATPEKIYMINEAAGTCMEVDVSRPGKKVDVDPFKDAKIENLGKEMVNGYNCTHVRITEGIKDMTMDIWVTKDMLDYFAYERMQGSRDRNMPKLAERLKAAGLDGFPVRTKISPAGIVTDLTKVERTSLDDALFKVPDNCTKMQVPTAPQGMTPEKMKEMQEFARKMQQQSQKQ